MLLFFCFLKKTTNYKKKKNLKFVFMFFYIFFFSKFTVGVGSCCGAAGRRGFRGKWVDCLPPAANIDPLNGKAQQDNPAVD